MARLGTRGWGLETGDWRPETGDRRLETGDWRPETGDWRLETGDWRPETGDWRPETGDRRLETRDWRPEIRGCQLSAVRPDCIGTRKDARKERAACPEVQLSLSRRSRLLTVLFQGEPRLTFSAYSNILI